MALSQSNSILTYAGELAGLVPSDPLQAALSDSVLNVLEDFWWYMPHFRVVTIVIGACARVGK